MPKRNLRSFVGAVFLGALIATCPSTSRAGLFSTVYRLDNYVAGFKTTGEAQQREAYASPGWYYELITDVDGTARVRFARHGRAKKGEESKSGEVEAGQIYAIEDSILKQPGNMVLVQTFETGVLAVPFKFRPKVPGTLSQLSGSGTLGAAFAWRAKTDFSTTEVSPLLFVGLSQVALQQDEGTAAKEVQALTLATGVQIEIIGRTKLGVVAGWDRAFGTEGETWPYQGRPWLSIGINYTFLTAEENPKK